MFPLGLFLLDPNSGQLVENNDYSATLNKENIKRAMTQEMSPGKRPSLYLDELLQYDNPEHDVFKKRPELAKTKVILGDHMASYSPDEHVIYFDPRLGVDVLLHEVQHGLQHIDKRPGGANSFMYRPVPVSSKQGKFLVDQLKQFKDWVWGHPAIQESSKYVQESTKAAENAWRRGGSREELAELGQQALTDQFILRDMIRGDYGLGPVNDVLSGKADTISPKLQYWINPGEIEAREVDYRWYLNPDQSKKLPYTPFNPLGKL